MCRSVQCVWFHSTYQEEVGGSIPGCEISSLLDWKAC